MRDKGKIQKPSVMVIPVIENGEKVGVKHLWSGFIVDTRYMLELRRKQGDLIEMNNRSKL